MDIDMAEMAYFDFKKQFSVTIINDDEEVDSTVHVKSHFFSNQNSPSRKVSDDQEFNNNSTSLTKEKTEGKGLTVLKILKDKIIKNTSDDSAKIHCIHKKKKKSKKSKSNSKEKKAEKEVTSRLKDLEPIDMEPVPSSSPSNKADSKHIAVNNNDQFNTLEETDSSLKKYEKEDVSKQYINDLLAKVSESLIHILDAYYNHVAAMQCNNDSRFSLESKRRFTRIKQHFFQLSYCTTNIIILSRENDSQFTDEFLKNTVKIAEAKNKKLTVQQIQPIYYELISWVKQKKELQNLPLNQVPQTYNNLPELRKHLTQPTVSSSISSIPYNVIPKVSIYNSDSQNREIRISLEPNLLTTREENNGTISNHASAHTSQPHSDKTMPPRFHATEPRYTEFDPIKYYNIQMSRGSNGVIKHSHRPNVSEITATTTNPLKDNSGYYQSSSGYPYSCIVPNCFCQNHNQADVANPMNVRFPANLPSYDQLFPWRNENISALNNVDTTRSSVSTDSGFISPQQEISPLESMVNMKPTGEDLNLSVTPLITHVTSLNPRALQIVEGSCHVCGASTKKKCLGCYHVYYCSYECQRLDWSQHMNICKSKAASRPSPNLVQLIPK